MILEEVCDSRATELYLPPYSCGVDWTLGSDGEAKTPAGGYTPAGVQHALFPGKVDATGLGRPLAPCGADVRPWPQALWTARTGNLPICEECIQITAKYPDPADA